MNRKIGRMGRLIAYNDISVSYVVWTRGQQHYRLKHPYILVYNKTSMGRVIRATIIKPTRTVIKPN